MRRALALIAIFTLALVAPAAAGGPDHVVSVSPTAAGQSIHRSGVQVGVTGSDTVDSTNLARATPHDCTGCDGVAVAFQAVIATGSPHTVSPRNAAVAVNSNCTSCNAFAFAYQYVVMTDGPAHLSADGRARVNDIRSQVADAINAGLSDPDLDARLQDLAAQFQAAVHDGLQSAGEHPHDGRDTEDVDTQGG